MRTLPAKDVKVSKTKSVPGTWASQRDHRELIASTGHPIRDGHRRGEDNFLVFLDQEKPGIGVPQNLDSGPNFDGPEYPTYSTYSWRPILCRQFESTVYEVDYPGVYNPIVTNRDFPDVVVPEMSDFTLDLNDQGTKFIRLCRPGNPLANMGQFILELREIPNIPFLQRRAKYFARLGGEFLNVTFGWQPFVKDLVKLYKLQRILEKRLNDLRRGNGLIQKRTRSRVVPPETTYPYDGVLNRPFGDLSVDEQGDPVEALENFVLLGPGGHHPSWIWYGITGKIDLTVTKTIDRTDWYSGLFRYYVPDIGSSRWTDKAKLALHESNVTPSVLYEVYPWSWLLDWFTNVGDIVSNLSVNAVENEVLVNSFIMSRQREVTEIALTTTWDDYTAGSGINYPKFVVRSGSDYIKWSHLKLSKMRHPASPFGFGISSATFTTKQWLILSALGLTHQRYL